MLVARQVVGLLSLPTVLWSLAGFAVAQSGDAPMAGWVNVTSNVGGENWTKLGPPAPVKPNGITYSDGGKCFYAWRLSDNMKREKQSILRLDVR